MDISDSESEKSLSDNSEDIVDSSDRNRIAQRSNVQRSIHDRDEQGDIFI